MEKPPYSGADFSSLAETPPPTPEKKLPDDDDDLEEEPKSLFEFLKPEPEKLKDEKPQKPAPDKEAQVEEKVENDGELEDGVELEPKSKEMTEEEEPEVAIQISEDRQEELQDAPAAVAFHETLQNELKDGKPVDQALDNAEGITLEAAGIEVPDELEPQPEPRAEPPTPPERPSDIIAVPDEPPAEDGPPIPIPPVPPVSPPIPPGGPGGPGLPPFGPGSMRGPGGLGRAGGNILSPAPNMLPEAEPDTGHDRHSHAPYVLAGGLVGYLLGRRRGRIKTEKKLLPIQHKLEKEVADLKDKIFWREARVQSLVQEQMAKKPETGQKITEHLRKQQEQKKTPREEEPELQRREKLGKFAVTTEQPNRPESFNPEKLRKVESMTLAELLLIAERIPIERSDLRQLFEAGRLDDPGLRRIIRAYLQGERIERLLRENLRSEGTHERLAESRHEQQPGQPIDNPQQFEAIQGGAIQAHAPHAQSLHERLRQAGTNTPAPFAEWVEPKAAKKQQNNAVIIAATTVAFILIVLVVAMVLL